MEQKIQEKMIGRNYTLNVTHDFIKHFQQFEFLIGRDKEIPDAKTNNPNSKTSSAIRKLIIDYLREHQKELLSLKNEYRQWKANNYYSDGRRITFNSIKKKKKSKHEKRSKKYEQEDIEDNYETEEDQDVTEALKKSEEEE